MNSKKLIGMVEKGEMTPEEFEKMLTEKYEAIQREQKEHIKAMTRSRCLQE